MQNQRGMKVQRELHPDPSTGPRIMAGECRGEEGMSCPRLGAIVVRQDIGTENVLCVSAVQTARKILSNLSGFSA